MNDSGNSFNIRQAEGARAFTVRAHRLRDRGDRRDADGSTTEGAEVTLTLHCEPRYSHLASRLRSPIALTVRGERVAGHIVAVHPSGINTVELTAELR